MEKPDSMSIEENCEARTIRRKTPVGVADRHPREFAARAVFQIERDKDEIGSHELAEDAQSGWNPCTLVMQLLVHQRRQLLQSSFVSCGPGLEQSG